MPAQIVLLRGINLVRANRLAMADLRAALEADGFGQVRTYVQSGNIVLSSGSPPADLAAAVRQSLADRFGLNVAVVVRTAPELADAVAHNPFGDEATLNPKLLQVTFRDEEASPEVLAALEARAGGGEKVAAVGREIYSWHPDGIARSRLASKLTPAGAAATARNWTTVTTLLEMATNGA
jgi:uncharacterized protein (DUF1697 family)